MITNFKIFESILNNNFWKWFGNSVVINTNNKPKIVYHGSNMCFDEFKCNSDIFRGDNGIYFTDSESHAQDYGHTIYKVYLKIEKPVILDAQHKYFNDFYDILIRHINYIQYSDEYDGIIINNIKDPKNGEQYKDGDGNWIDYDSNTIYIVFNSNQIKSINNNGNFDINSENINEYRKQLEIPFDDKHPIKDKPVHVHVVDFLEELDMINNVKLNTYYSNWKKTDIEKVWNENLNNAYETFKEQLSYIDNEIDLNIMFIENYNPLNNLHLFNKEINDYVSENEGITDDELIDKFDLKFGILYDYLSIDGQHIINNETTKQLFDERVDQFEVKYALKNGMDENGLITIYRAMSYNPKGDIYEEIKNFNGVGIYWTFDIDRAFPHNSKLTNKSVLILIAKVKPEYINWSNTIYKSAYYLNNEHEVEINKKSDVMIIDIIDYHSRSVVNLKKQLIVKV